MRESLIKTIENKRQMMMTKLTKAEGQEFQSVILLMSTGCETNMGVTDWMV